MDALLVTLRRAARPNGRVLRGAAQGAALFGRATNTHYELYLTYEAVSLLGDDLRPFRFGRRCTAPSLATGEEDRSVLTFLAGDYRVWQALCSPSPGALPVH